MKTFDIPYTYRSSFISTIKEKRKVQDPRKKDFCPTTLDFGPIQFIIARHFGFCYGVENAIERAYSAVEENPDKRIFLLSQMIHNPSVNADLKAMGIQFIMDTDGNQFVSWNDLTSDDIILIPAFGTTLEIEDILTSKGIEIRKYDTTCPFVTKVWKQSEKLGNNDYTVIIHGKHRHEETRATFSHSSHHAKSIVIKDMCDAVSLGTFILEDKTEEEFKEKFGSYCSKNFNHLFDLKKIGVVNQTTMLASETQAIADYFKQIMIEKYGEGELLNHFADTRDTLCYATNDNQEATYALLESNADLAIVVGGYNSSNTSHLVELCEEKLPTYFISNEKEILSKELIQHFDIHENELKKSPNFLPNKNSLKIILTSGASCPDAVVDSVLNKLLGYFDQVKSKEEVLLSLD